MFHFLYIGHFEHEGSHLRFKTPSNDTPSLTPVLSRHLDKSIIESLLEEQGTAPERSSLFPNNWPMWLRDGFIHCDQSELTSDVVDFINRLVTTTGCEIVDISAGRFLKPDEVHASQLTP